MKDPPVKKPPHRYAVWGLFQFRIAFYSLPAMRSRRLARIRFSSREM